ncbi:hypothetical protein BS17DRAFT_772836 [Gyrodon lividus]|nr:hypothetical protein BS17DRAFT_772836 [Gyrodon lividus]
MPQGKIRRVQFTQGHDLFLMKYIAKYCPTKDRRSGRTLYQDLVANKNGLWPWSKQHSWQSWRERYVKNAQHFDPHIAKYQQKSGIPRSQEAGSHKAVANGRRLPVPLPENSGKAEVKMEKKRVAERQSEHTDSRKSKRPRVETDDPSTKPSGTRNDNSLPSVKVERNEDEKKLGSHVQSSTVPTLPNGGDPAKSTATPSNSVSPGNGGQANVVRSRPRAQPNGDTVVVAEAHSQGNTHTLDDTLPTTQAHPPGLSHDTADVQTAATAPTSHPVDQSVSTTLDLPPLSTRNNTLVLPSSSPDKQSSPSGQVDNSSGQDKSQTSPHRQQRLRKRPRAPSEVFASVPPSPRRVSADANVASASHPADQSAPATSDSHPSVSVYSRAPPRIVETLFGQVLVDQMGHVPRFCSAAAHEDEDEDEDEKEQWPPARARSVRGKGKVQVVPEHHAFSQPQPRYETEVVARAPYITKEMRSPPSTIADKNIIPHPFSQASRSDARDTAKGAPQKLEVNDMDRRTIATRFLGRNDREVPKGPEAKGEDRKRKEAQKVRDNSSPSERASLRAPPHEPLVVPTSRKSFKFPAPRASTLSPFRLPFDRQSTFRTVRQPALARVRRQTIGHGHENVPSIDLVAMSTSASVSSTTSHRSSVPVSGRHPRWSLSAHTTPPLFREGATPSFRWPAPAPLYTDPHGHVPSPSLTSAPSVAPSLSLAPTFTPSPGATSHAGTPTNLTPHPADLPISASHGLASILAHMSANHGLALSVVHAVYSRVGSLREADDILRGMREAAEGFGEAEIKRRTSRGSAWEQGEGSVHGHPGRMHTRRASEGAQPRLQYVFASEDGEGSEYSPPETTRAAMWKRQSVGQIADMMGDDTAGAMDEGSDDVGDARGVDEESERDEGRGDEVWLPGVHHDFSQQVPADVPGAGDTQGLEHDAWEERSVEALLVNEEALQLEQKVGKDKYRRFIVSLFG